ncbi:hypothetical protein AA313_de0209450 [Arthrobotrys entomopaga]|nr:hypothetical protein AA313_de0209450 [Arthrobotrys entomopaga]
MKAAEGGLQYTIISSVKSIHVIRFSYDRKDGEIISVSPEIKWDGEGLESPLAAYIYAASQAYMQPKCYSVLERPYPPRGPVERWRFDEIEKLMSPIPGIYEDALEVVDTENLVFLPGRHFLVEDGKSVLEGEVVHKKKNIAARVVLKLFNCVDYERHAKAYSRELAIYEQLSPLQGKHIPRLYVTGTIDYHWGVLVLEHCGKSLRDWHRSDTIDGSLAKEVKTGAKKALEAIHKCNVLHTDIESRNIVFEKTKGGMKVKFVDFERSILSADARVNKFNAEMNKLNTLKFK